MTEPTDEMIEAAAAAYAQRWVELCSAAGMPNETTDLMKWSGCSENTRAATRDAIRAALTAAMSVAPGRGEPVTDEQVKELSDRLYANFCIKYDPEAANRCIRRALEQSSSMGVARGISQKTWPVPRGWQIVPKVPTCAMVSADCRARNNRGSTRTAYQAMLAASPTPPAPAGEAWHSMDSAPKDGTPILAARDNGCAWEQFVVWWSGHHEYPWCAGASDLEAFPEGRLDVWQPLPAPPAPKTEERE